MQIDFHHAVTYVVARLAGFADQEAQVIAYCAQYVDDATNAGLIRFHTGETFHHISSAHKFLDYRNFRELAHHQVWMPFHFLPGNGGLPADQSPVGSFIAKLICRPNSCVAQDLLAECLQHRDAPYGLYWWGIAMHVYADTWAHQGFAGINDQVNEAKLLVDAHGHIDHKATEKVKRYFRKTVINRCAQIFISDVFPLGHGAVLSKPDRPYLRWGYINGFNQKIMRDNPRDFLEAADQMCRWMRRYVAGTAQADCPGLLPQDKQQISELLQTIQDRNHKARHNRWLAALKAGVFSFGPADLTYRPKGKGSWKHQALGTEAVVDTGTEVFEFQSAFPGSHWKQFHEALKIHRRFVMDHLLPRYGICMGQSANLTTPPAQSEVPNPASV